MALLSKSEFAAKCFIPTKTLSIYIARKEGDTRVICRPDGVIDDQDPINARFVAKRVAFAMKKGKIDAAAPEKPVVTTPAPAKNSLREDNKPTAKSKSQYFFENEELKIQLQNEKLQEEIIKIRVGNQKMLGNFLKVDQVKMLFPIYSESLNGAWEALLDDFIKLVTVKYQLTRDEITAFKAEKNNIINRAKERAVNTAKASLRKAQEEISARKGVGQHE